MDADAVRLISELSEEQAHALVGLRLDDLPLDSLSSLSADVARILTRQDGGLALNGLVSLADDVAEARAAHEGVLSLDGLTTLTPSLAERLAKHESLLYLDGVTELSQAAAAALAKHAGPMLSLTSLSQFTLDGLCIVTA
jgi:hypothetical protein